MPHVVDKLHRDHQKVDELIEKLLATSESAEKARTNLCRQITQELQAHSEFEEKIFYPSVRQESEDAEDEVAEALEEHREVDDMLQRLEDMDPTSDEFIDAVTELQDAVQAHVRHEEEDIFPIAKQGMEKSEAEQMAKQHDAMAKEFMQAHR